MSVLRAWRVETTSVISHESRRSSLGQFPTVKCCILARDGFRKMLPKVELELKQRSDQRRDLCGAKPTRQNAKVELELKKPREKEVNLIFTDSWRVYNDCDMSSVVRRCEEGKEMLVYRGKRSDGSTMSSDSSSIARSDDNERSESTLSDFFSGSDQVFNLVEEESDRDVSSPPNDPSQESLLPAELAAAPNACSSPKQNRYCWYCYETYKAMCVAQGKTPPGVYSRGLWRGHCMRDANGMTTCPHLWFTTCTHCGATASSAHSPDFCPVVEFASLNVRDQ
ncbi:unnamed protein product [Cylicocyclus nassatus]|uniref:Nanos-type domain-containing protein n=1 Tax=Cylicocyclus nassatus TaxID=53992 RepID=A0AA36DV09_CYLNA|nr:unnamed protein product [Cylicocyclus nassatus]